MSAIEIDVLRRSACRVGLKLGARLLVGVDGQHDVHRRGLGKVLFARCFAKVAFADGEWVGATLDRNGLRPARYTILKNNFMVFASEAGVWFFVGSDGAMLVSCTTPDGYQVDAEGKWHE